MEFDTKLGFNHRSWLLNLLSYDTSQIFSFTFIRSSLFRNCFELPTFTTFTKIFIQTAKGNFLFPYDEYICRNIKNYHSFVARVCFSNIINELIALYSFLWTYVLHTMYARTRGFIVQCLFWNIHLCPAREATNSEKN